MSPLQVLARRIRLSISLCVVRLADDVRKLQQLQVSLLDDELRDQVNRYQNYGHTSNPLPGAEALAVAVGGNRNHLVVIVVDDPRYRKPELEPGEHALYHWEGDSLHFKNGRVVELIAGTKVRVQSPEVEIVASTKVTFDTPLVQMTGALQVDGAAVVSGALSSETSVSDPAGSMAEMRGQYNGHTHSGVTAGPGVTGAPSPSMS